MAHIAFHESCNFIEDSFTGNENDLTHNVPGTENILLKTQFFSRIGIGRKTMQTISIEHQRSIAAYIQKEDPHSENRYLKEDLQNLGNLQKSSKADIDFEMKEKENRSNNIDQGDKRKQPLSMKTKSQSLDILAMKSKDNNLESISQCAGNFEFAEEEVDENSAIEAELNVIEEGSSSDFFIKTDQQIRTCYYNRLIQMRILKPTPSKKNQNIIIFDWDDTLLCTSYLIALGIKTAAPAILSVLRPVDEIASKLLNKAVELGQVFIITNAEQGWVQSSARNFLPKTSNVIEKANITVISARSCYEDEFPGDTERWKKEAFSSLSRMFEKDLITNLICIGDSNAEIDAAHILAKKFDSAIIKTIKFKEKPKPEELTKQHCLVLDKFDKLFVSLRNSAIRLERKCI